MFLQGVSCFALVMSPAPKFRFKPSTRDAPIGTFLLFFIREMEQKWNSLIAGRKNNNSNVLALKYYVIGGMGAVHNYYCNSPFNAVICGLHICAQFYMSNYCNCQLSMSFNSPLALFGSDFSLLFSSTLSCCNGSLCSLRYIFIFINQI